MAIWRTTVRTEYRAPGGPGYMTFHFRDSDLPGGLPVEGQLLEATGVLQDAFARLVPEQPVSTDHVTDGVWQEIDGTREINVVGWRVTPTANDNGVLSGNNCVVVGWRTADRTRRGRGRTFISGYGVQSTVDGTPSGTSIATAGLFAQEVVNFNAAGLNGAFVVYSPTDGLGRDITGYAVRDVWGSLRSRRD